MRQLRLCDVPLVGATMVVKDSRYQTNVYYQSSLQSRENEFTVQSVVQETPVLCLRKTGRSCLQLISSEAASAHAEGSYNLRGSIVA